MSKVKTQLTAKEVINLTDSQVRELQEYIDIKEVDIPMMLNVLVREAMPLMRHKVLEHQEFSKGAAARQLKYDEQRVTDAKTAIERQAKEDKEAKAEYAKLMNDDHNANSTK